MQRNLPNAGRSVPAFGERFDQIDRDILALTLRRNGNDALRWRLILAVSQGEQRIPKTGRIL